ncbi:hypothetical protein GGI07_004480 [Coemansia sp. Benny D115]|nr:hypothetical protein GGI07_004480 [Coemansia sp. Benny D115]
MKVFSLLAALLCVIFLGFADAALAEGVSSDVSSQVKPQSGAEQLSQPSSKSPQPAAEMSHAEARSMAAQLSVELIDTLYEMRSLAEQKTLADSVARAKNSEDDDSGDDDSGDSTTKLLNQASSALRPLIKEFGNVVGSVLPAGPQQQLVKATVKAINSLLPLILKYAIGI